MKKQLYYQLSEYDCGTVSMLNALNFTLNKNEIHPALLKSIYVNSLDKLTEGTSMLAMEKISNELNNLSNSLNIPLAIKYSNDVNILNIKNELTNGNCIVLRTKLDVEHYILLTEIDNKYIYAFDSYYLPKKTKINKDIKISDNLFYNRRIKIKYFILPNQNLSINKKNSEMIIFSRV